MNRFSIDYGDPARQSAKLAQQQGQRWRLAKRSAMKRYVLAGVFLLLCLLVSSGVTLRQLHTENRQLRDLHDQQRLQYDSLLSAKLEADRRLHRLLKQAPNASNGFLTAP